MTTELATAVAEMRERAIAEGATGPFALVIHPLARAAIGDLALPADVTLIEKRWAPLESAYLVNIAEFQKNETEGR